VITVQVFDCHIDQVLEEFFLFHSDPFPTNLVGSSLILKSLEQFSLFHFCPEKYWNNLVYSSSLLNSFGILWLFLFAPEKLCDTICLFLFNPESFLEYLCLFPFAPEMFWNASVCSSLILRSLERLYLLLSAPEKFWANLFHSLKSKRFWNEQFCFSLF